MTASARRRLRKILEVAKANLSRDGWLLPALFVDGAQELVVGLQELPPTAEERRAMLFALGRKLAPYRPRRVIFVVDAYMRTTPEELPPDRSLADDPRAAECIVVTALDRAGRQVVLVCPYERSPRLEGLLITFKPVIEHSAAAEVHLLEAFFEGVAASSPQG